MNNENVLSFKCKIGYNFYFIKILLIEKHVNIEIDSVSSINKKKVKYINDYSLSHFHEINPYFKMFTSIKEIYKNIIKIIKNKKFCIIQNQDNTLTFILKIQIHDKVRKIKLALSKCKNSGIYNPTNIYNENYTDTLNYEILNLRNKIDTLEQNQYLLTYSNNYLQTNKFSVAPNNEYSQLETIISKMNQLENENNDKNKRIEILEKQLNAYEKNNNIDEEEEEESDDLDNDKKINNNKNEINNINKNSFKNKKKKIRRYNSFDKANSINSNFNHKNENLEESNNYIPNRDKSMDIKINKIKTLFPRHNKNNEKLKSNLSINQLPNNCPKIKTYIPSIKLEKFINSIPPAKRDKNLKVNSKIIFTNKEVNFITQRISEGEYNIKVQLILIYRASSDGDFENAVKMKCENKLITLTLFQTMEGARFGFYIERRKKTTLKSGTKILEIPGSSFLVGLNDLVIYNVSYRQNSLFYKNDNLLCFGYCSSINNNKTKWLVNTPRNNFLGKKCLFGDKNDIYFNLKTTKIIGNNLAYHIKEVEVFEVKIIYRDEN
jgi:hypothetical protein